MAPRRSHEGMMVATVSPMVYPLQWVSEVRDLREVPPGVERHLRLDLRVLLNQNNGTFEETNAIADDLATHILRAFSVRETGATQYADGVVAALLQLLKDAIGYGLVPLSIREHPEITREYRTMEDREGLVERISTALISAGWQPPA